MRTIWQPSPLDRAVPQYTLLQAAQCVKIAFASHYPEWDGTQYVWHDNVQQVNAQYHDLMAQNKFQFEIFNDPHWLGEHDIETLAQRFTHDIAEATGHNSLLQCSYSWDIEWPYRDGAWLLALFKRCRALRPGRYIVWTMEPHQGGWIKNYPDLVHWINADPHFWIVGQTFNGDMSPWNPDDVRNDLIAAGFLPAKVKVFLDAARPRPAGWDGYLFHAERLVVASTPQVQRALRADFGVADVTALDDWRARRYAESVKAAA